MAFRMVLNPLKYMGFAAFLAASCFAPEAKAQDMTALARAFGEGSAVVDKGRGIELQLNLSQAVPFRVFTLDAPRRLVIDFSEVDWQGFDRASFDRSEKIGAVRVGGFVPGWSRMVMDLDAPLRLQSAQMQRTEAGATLNLAFKKTDDETFAAQSGTPEEARLLRRTTTQSAKTALDLPPLGARPIRVMLDPGHGGVDPGAERDGVREADLMLQFAQELKDVLTRSGRFEIALTREADVFVPLETRVAMQRDFSADVFLSLHADALAEGVAQGATIYTLADRASDAASQKLAERHDRDSLLAGVDLTDQDDVIATVLMDMARTETRPRTNRLADALVATLSETVGTYKRPRLSAGFSVLKSPDVPSVLLELGFISSAKDRAKLVDPVWRGRAAIAIRDALIDWEEAEVAAQSKLRK